MSYEVHCSSCQGRLVIPDELWSKRFVGRVQSLKCKKCGDRIRVDARPEPPLLEASRLGAPLMDRPVPNEPGPGKPEEKQAPDKSGPGTQGLGKSAQGKPAQGKPAQGKSAQGKPAQGKPTVAQPAFEQPAINRRGSAESVSAGPALEQAAQPGEASRAGRTEVSVVFRLPDLPPPDPAALESGQLIPAEPQAVVESTELFDDDDELYTRDTLIRSSLAAKAQLALSPTGSAHASGSAGGAATPEASLDSQPGAALDGSPQAVPQGRSRLRQVFGLAAGLIVVASLIVWLRPRATADAGSDSAVAAPEPAFGVQGGPRPDRAAAPRQSEPVEPENVPAAVPELAAAEAAQPVVGQPLDPAPSEPEPTLLLGTAEDPLERQVDRLVEHVMECHLTGRAIGTATMKITIKPSGRVTHVSVVGDPIERAPVARCVKVRGLATRFAPFEGDAPIVVNRELVFADFPRRSAPSK